VNIETDLLAKYVHRALVTLTGVEADKRLLDALARSGFVD
jgi:hypothetical protein